MDLGGFNWFQGMNNAYLVEGDPGAFIHCFSFFAMLRSSGCHDLLPSSA